MFRIQIFPKWFKIEQYLLLNINRKSYVIYRMVVFPMNLNNV